MLSAFEFARNHIPIEIAKQYTLKEKKQSPTTIRKDQTLLGIEIVPSADGSYPTITIHPIKVLGFCDQGLFSEKIKRPSKKVRTYKEHPIDSDLLSEIYPRLSKYRKENKGLGWSHYEPPTMVAQSLLPSKKPYILLQANDTLDDGLSWKNGKSEITWFVLIPNPNSGRFQHNEKAPSAIVETIQANDKRIHPMETYRHLQVGRQCRPHHLKKGDLITTYGVLQQVSFRTSPPHAFNHQHILFGKVVGFVKPTHQTSYLQPKTYVELEERLTVQTTVHFFSEDTQEREEKQLPMVQWNYERGILLGEQVDYTQEFVKGTWEVYPTWEEIPKEYLIQKGDLCDYAPKLLLLISDLYTTEICQPIEIHIPSLQPQVYNQPIQIYALQNQMENKICERCSLQYGEVYFNTIDAPYCIDCTQQVSVLKWSPTTLQPLLQYLFEYETIESMEFEDNSLYLRIQFGNGHVRDYRQFLPTSFVKKSRKSIEVMSKFGGASAYPGIEIEYVSEHPKSTLCLSYDDEHGMDIELWIEVGGAQ